MKISIIIPFKQRLDLLNECLRSILHYQAGLSYEVILIDNNDTAQHLDPFILKQVDSEKFSIQHIGGPFNYSRLMNLAAGYAKGEVLLHLNSDIEILHDNWLSKLYEIVKNHDIGCVGCLLTYPNKKVQHAGVLLNKKGHTQHFKQDVLLQDITPSVYDIPAVTGAALAIRKNLYLEIGGMNEQLAVAYNDIDLCLKVSSKGYRNICSTEVHLLHHESASRGRDLSREQRVRYLKEQNIFYKTWKKTLKKYPSETAFSYEF